MKSLPTELNTGNVSGGMMETQLITETEEFP